MCVAAGPFAPPRGPPLMAPTRRTRAPSGRMSGLSRPDTSSARASTSRLHASSRRSLSTPTGVVAGTCRSRAPGPPAGGPVRPTCRLRGRYASTHGHERRQRTRPGRNAVARRQRLAADRRRAEERTGRHRRGRTGCSGRLVPLGAGRPHMHRNAVPSGSSATSHSYNRTVPGTSGRWTRLPRRTGGSADGSGR